MVKKEIDKSKTKSKYFRQRDFVLAKKAIKQMEKSQWTKALSISKKARDKSIYNFIQWKHLLTTGNKLVSMIIKFLLIKIKIIQELVELNIWLNTNYQQKIISKKNNKMVWS